MYFTNTGLDAVDFIRRNLPEDGNLRVDQVIEVLKQDDWNRPDNPKDSPSHTSPMALAEIMIKVMDNVPDGLDYDDAWAEDDKKFAGLASFTADKESIVWMKQIAALCLTAFMQTSLLFLGLLTFPGNMLLGLGIMLAANEVPRIAQQFGLDSSVRVNMMSVVHATTTAVNLTRSVARAAGK